MKPLILGLTGSIAMGKTTIGAMLETMGVPVHESDACVHMLLEADSPARKSIAAAFPVYQYPQIYDKKNYSIKRKELGALVFSNDELREALEEILHPLVQQDQQDFINAQGALGREMVCLDIPLLFETDAQKRVDYTLVVTAPADIQRQRALGREGMDEAKLAGILSRQMSDAQKCHRANYVIKTGLGRAYSMKLLKEALTDIRRHLT